VWFGRTPYLTKENQILLLYAEIKPTEAFKHRESEIELDYVFSIRGKNKDVEKWENSISQKDDK
jgi:hypothetical protein